MLFNRSHPQILSRFKVLHGPHCAWLFCRIPPLSPKLESTLPAVAYACRGDYSYSQKVEHPYQTMPSRSLHPDTTPVVWNVRSLANRQNQQLRGALGNSQLPLAKRDVSVPAGERDSSQGESSIASTIQGQNSTPSASQNNSRVADITQRMASTPSAAQQLSIHTSATTPGTLALGGTSQTDSTRHVVSSPASSIASTPTPLSGLENPPTPIPNPEARAIITNPLPTLVTERNQIQRQWQ